ncbi:MAG: response regulator [Bacteroidia bacterium]|nr:response regulator [Bacteroidia bacterium]
MVIDNAVAAKCTKYILILDDEEDICWLLSDILNRKGYKSLVAGSISTGKKLIQEFNPLLVFLDINLPDGSSLEALPELRIASPETKFIVMSAYASGKERLKAIEEGALNFIGKPLSIESLENILLEIETP